MTSTYVKIVNKLPATDCKQVGLVATLRRERIEVPAPRNGRPGYRWAQGYVVRIGDGPEMFPPVLRAEAYRMAREAGATSVSIIG